MYPRSKFQEVLLEIRQEMASEAEFDVDLFTEIVRTGAGPRDARIHSLADKAASNGDAARRSRASGGRAD